MGERGRAGDGGRAGERVGVAKGNRVRESRRDRGRAGESVG